MYGMYDLTRFAGGDFNPPNGGEFMSTWEVHLFDQAASMDDFKDLQRQMWLIEDRVKRGSLTFF